MSAAIIDMSAAIIDMSTAIKYMEPSYRSAGKEA